MLGNFWFFLSRLGALSHCRNLQNFVGYAFGDYSELEGNALILRVSDDSFLYIMIVLLKAMHIHIFG